MLVSKKNKELIAAWKEVKKILDKAKARESELRDKIVDNIFSKRTEGSNLVELDHGYRIKCNQTYRYDIDEDVLKVALKQLPRGSKKKLIKTKVSLIKKGYDALDDDSRYIFEDCLVLTPSKPQLEIIAPKKEEV